MSFMKTSIPLTVYRVESSTLANVTGDRIRQYAFRSIDQTPDELGSGFVPDTDMVRGSQHLDPRKGQLHELRLPH